MSQFGHAGLNLALVVVLARCFQAGAGTAPGDHTHAAGPFKDGFSVSSVATWAVQVAKNVARIKLRVNPNLISSQCYQDLSQMLDKIASNSTYYSTTPFWPENMLDAFGKMPSGLIEGNIFWMGDFKQCTNVKVWKNTNDRNPSGPPDFKGKYCIPSYNHYVEPQIGDMLEPIPIVSSIGICVPSTCKAFDVQQFFNEVSFPLRLVVEERHCLTDDAHPIDEFTFYVLLILGALVSIVLIGSILDITPLVLRPISSPSDTTSVSNRQGTLKTILLLFSAYTNTKKLLNTSHSNEMFTAINGLRALSMMLVVGGHSIALLFVSAGRPNPLQIATYLKNFWAQPLINGTYVVDTFFCMTGFLVAYHVIAFKVVRYNVLAFYAHRIWRLTPAYMLLTVFAAGPFQQMYTGPLSISPVLFNTTICRENLWKTPLYIEIYTQLGKPMMCMPHCWYLCCEQALYVMAGLLMYPIVKKHWTGPVLWTLTFLASILVVGILGHTHNLQSIISPYTHGMHVKDFFEEIYLKPWGRAQPFLVGMFFGYVYYHKGKNLKLSKGFVTMMWTLTVIGMLGCVYINYPYVIDYYRKAPSHLRYVMYLTFNTSVWSACIGWIILASATGYGGVVNKILSWKLLIPVGRLSFSAYLVHFIILANFATSRKHALYVDFYLAVFTCVSMNVVTTIAAWLVSLLIESPSLQLESMMLAAKKRTTKGRQIASKGDNSTEYERVPTN